MQLFYVARYMSLTPPPLLTGGFTAVTHVSARIFFILFHIVVVIIIIK